MILPWPTRPRTRGSPRSTSLCCVGNTDETAGRWLECVEPGREEGTLANGGVGLADFHRDGLEVSAELQAELDQVKADIIAGSIQTSP